MAGKEELEKVYGKAPELDLSLVANASAAKKTGNDITKFSKDEGTKIKERKSKFNFAQEHIVQIPTKGYLYQDADDEDIRNGIVRLVPMSIADEEIIANQSYIKNGTVFVNLLNSCIKNNFDARNFVPYDVFFLIYQLRQISYGTDYTFEVTCSECEKEYEFELDMTDVEFEELKEKESAIKEIFLPISKFTVIMRESILGDEEAVYKNSKNSEYSETILGFVARTIKILDEEKNEIDRRDYPEFFLALLGADRAEITKQFKNVSLSIPTITCVCPKCGHEEERTIPFSKRFFRY